MASVRVVVMGRVQGVGFRAYVMNQALRHGVRGEVFNRRDGAVEALAVCEEDTQLHDFAHSLRTGPGRVDQVVVEPSVESWDGDGFRIGPTR